MPNEYTIFFTSMVIEIFVLLFVGYEVVIGEIRHRKSMTAMTEQVKSVRRGISMRLGLSIVLISAMVWATIVIGFDRLNSGQLTSPSQIRELSQLSDLVTATVKVPWIDAKLKELNEASKKYDETYKEAIRNDKPFSRNKFRCRTTNC